MYYLFIFLLQSCFNTPKPYIYQADIYFKNGMYNDAIKLYQKELKIRPDSIIAHKNIGIMYAYTGNYLSSISHLRKSLKFFKNDFDVNFYLANGYRAQRLFAQSIFYYKNALQINPNSLKALKYLSWTYYEIRYYKQAINLIKNLYKKHPNDKEIPIIYSRVLIKLKNYNKAFYIIKKGLKNIDKKDVHFRPYMFSILGDIYYEVKKINKAYKNYKKSLAIQPLIASALLGFGKCLAKKNRLNDGIKYIERAIKIKPELYEAYFQLGLLYENKNIIKSVNYYRIYYKKTFHDPEHIYRMEKVTKKIAQLKSKVKFANKKILR